MARVQVSLGPRLLQPQGLQNDTVENTTRLEDLACALIPTFAAAQAQAKVEGLVLPTLTSLLLFYCTYQHNHWETDGGVGVEKAKIGLLHCT
jgi:hypothetical protein